MTAGLLGEADREQLRARGIPLEEAERQLRLLASARAFPELLRPATVGDGIERLGEAGLRDLLDRHARAAARGRLLWFVPASGAATRMFQDLLPLAREGPALRLAAVEGRARQGDASAATALRLLENLPRFAFAEELRAALSRRGEELERMLRDGRAGEILEALLGGEGLDLAAVPKGLVPFHRQAGRARTAFEEQLAEAAEVVADASRTCRLHFTVSPGQRERFERHLERVRGEEERRLGVHLEVGFSEQDPSTDTLAAEPGGAPLRDRDGRLVLRPSGHGALLGNLGAVEGDLALLKNIDNVLPEPLRGPSVHWRKLLAGRLVRLEGELEEHWAAIETSPADPARIARALDFARHGLLLEIPSEVATGTVEAKTAFLRDALDRPLRVCGVVPAAGEPGGAPFWVRGRDGRASLQIVEAAQVDPASPAAQEVFRSATHFNPVNIACSLRDRRGRPFDLRRFVDEEAVIVTRKSWEGRPILALERPGLWNGSMAGWITLFVEVPRETFAPVKTVLDLLRPEHRA